MAAGYLARHKRTAADLGAWLVFEDESGQGLRPPKGRTWGRRGAYPGGDGDWRRNKRVSLAALIAVKPGHRPRLIYRMHAPAAGTSARGSPRRTTPAPGRRAPAARRPRRAGLG